MAMRCFALSDSFPLQECFLNPLKSAPDRPTLQRRQLLGGTGAALATLARALPISPRPFGNLLQAAIGKWARVVRAAHIQPS